MRAQRHVSNQRHQTTGNDAALRPRRGRLPRVAMGLAGAAALGLAATSATPAAAFLDFLFGRPQAEPPAPVTNPLDVSVRPKRADRGHRHKRELGRAEARKAASSRQAAARQRHIDPVRTPDWYLHDPNIKRGDILVLKSGPVVYLGNADGKRSREDFVSLSQSRTLSASDRRELRMMASGVWTPPDVGTRKSAKRRR